MPKVMCVEDDNNLREIYEARMQAEGFDVVSAKDGEEALVVAKAEKPDLIVSDVMMPKISGFEMLDILRNTDGLKETKVIMLTALGQTDDQQRADRLGADRYLVKSQVTLEDIVNVAHQLLGDQPEEPAAPEPVAAVPAPADDPVVPVVSAPEPATAVPEPVAEPPVPPEPTPSTEPVVAPADPVVPAAPAMPEPAAVPAEPIVEPPVVPEPAPAPSPVPDPLPTPTEPVLPEPAPAPTPPAPEVQPAVVPAPPTTFKAVQVDAPAETVTASNALVEVAPDVQSSAQEEADVEAQIEDFVAGASSDAPSMDSTSTPEVASENTATDDKIMAEAVDSLNGTTSEPAPTPVPAITPLNPVQTTPEPAPAVEPAPPTPPAVPSSSPAVAGKKIIAPLTDSVPAPDINQLLAKEEANQILAGGTPGSSAVAPTVTPAPTSANDSSKIDPNSVAL